jgi:hypothetical protein
MRQRARPSLEGKGKGKGKGKVNYAPRLPAAKWQLFLDGITPGSYTCGNFTRAIGSNRGSDAL